jgi:hypothetical protein
MSSLRLALKQSLEHAGPSVREVQSKGKRRGRPKKNEKEQHKKRKKRKLTDSEKKLLKDDEEDVINENVRTPTSSRAQTSDSSDGDSDDDGSHDSSSGSSSSSSDNQSEKSGSGSDSGDDNSADSSSDDDGNSPIAATKLKTLGKNDNNSDDDESQDAHMMEGVFEAEVSSGDDEDTDNRAINNGNQSESLSSLPNARSRKIDRDISVSHHSQASISQASSSQLKRDKKVASSTSLASASKSQESKKISSVTKTKKKNVPPPRQEVLAWVMGMSQGKQRKNIKPGLRIKVRFTKPKIRWYGGVVTKVASSNPGGHKIKIRYDDGNKEVAEFPDKEIVVDAEGNGVHQANADAFLPRDLPVLLSVPVEKKKKKIKTSKSDDESQTGESNNNNDDSIQVSQKSDQKPEKKSTPQKIQRMEETKSLKSSSEKKGSPKKNKIQPIPKSLEDMLPRVDKSPAKKKISTHGIDAEAETDEETFMHDISRKSDDGKKHSDDAKNFTPVTKTIVLNKQSVESNTTLSHNSEFTNDNTETEGGEDDDMKSVEVSSQMDVVMEDNGDDTSLAQSAVKDDVSDKQSEIEYETSVKKVKSDKKVKKKAVMEDKEGFDDDDTGAEAPIDRRRKENKIASDGFKKKKRRTEKEDGRKRKKAPKEEEVTDSENWVQCERCMKWRCLLTLTNEEVENLPDKWFCEMNADVMRNFCAAPEQTAAEVARERKKKARGMKRSKSLSPTNEQSPTFVDIVEKQSRNSDSGDESQMVDDESNITSQSRRGRRGGRQPTEEKVRRGRGRASKQKEDDKQQEWVQCENCEKWRRLPLAVSAKDLPDKWYCSMNTWDPRSASCAVQEDYKKEEEKPKENILTGAGSGGASSGGSRLSYRNLIRQPTRTISERMRAADSIFSNHASVPYEEQSGFPVCLYATSSLFQQRMRFGAENNEPEPTTSLIDVMNQTQLWKNLYRADISNESTTSPWNISGKNLLADIKVMVYEVMSFGKALAVNEIMLECQCRDLGVKFREVSALVTFDLVSSAIDELVNEGKLEKVTGIPEKVLSTGEPDITTSDCVALFRKIEAEPMGESVVPKAWPTEVSPSNSIVEEKVGNITFNSSRLMKFSKPWKKQQIKFD